MQPERFFDGLPLQLGQAIQANRLDEVRRLAKEVPLNSFYNENMTPLIWAMLTKQPQALEVLLEAGADPNLADDKHVQPVALAVTIGDDNPYLKILLRHKGNPNSYKQSEPALHIAFESEFYRNVDLLLAAHGDIDIRDSDQETILIKSGYLEQFDQSLQLINKGADIRAVSESGGSIALQVQESLPEVGTKTYEDQARLKRMLLEKGINFPITHPSAKDYEPIRTRWYLTPEGKQWQMRLAAVGKDPLGFGQRWKEAYQAETAALKKWMAANNIPEPARPREKAIDPNE